MSSPVMGFAGEVKNDGVLSRSVFKGPDPFDPPEDWEEGNPWDPDAPQEVAVLEDEVEEAALIIPPGTPIFKAPLKWRVKNWIRKLRSGELTLPVKVWFARRWLGPGAMICTAELFLQIAHKDENGIVTGITNYGRVGRHLVTTAGKNYLASTMDNTAEPEVFKYHAFGTGTNAAAVGDTALQTECTTAYATDNTRPTGSQAHSTNTYTTVATFAPDANVANTEWGLASQASNAGGTFLDRQVYSAVNLVASADTLASTYVFTQG